MQSLENSDVQQDDLLKKGVNSEKLQEGFQLKNWITEKFVDVKSHMT
jgi:hypothetical protein